MSGSSEIRGETMFAFYWASQTVEERTNRSENWVNWTTPGVQRRTEKPSIYICRALIHGPTFYFSLLVLVSRFVASKHFKTLTQPNGTMFLDGKMPSMPAQTETRTVVASAPFLATISLFIKMIPCRCRANDVRQDKARTSVAPWLWTIILY